METILHEDLIPLDTYRTSKSDIVKILNKNGIQSRDTDTVADLRHILAALKNLTRISARHPNIKTIFNNLTTRKTHLSEEDRENYKDLATIEDFLAQRTNVYDTVHEHTDGEQTGNACSSSGNAYIKKPCDDVRGSHADMKNWHSPIMMERFGRGVVMSWRENNFKTEEQGGEEKVEDGNSKSDVRECNGKTPVKAQQLHGSPPSIEDDNETRQFHKPPKTTYQVLLGKFTTLVQTTKDGILLPRYCRTIKEQVFDSFILLITHSTERILLKDADSMTMLPLVTMFRDQNYNPRRQ
ncbi:hypothetical protein J6590_072773 [Homalodisca vitripennis]|nr:hypothetical protein J6590_072773 [Homalodisca vitripennis]